ncbi:MAG: hypothetical protein WBR56_17195 [Sedimenticolaceae bacterium]
MTKIVWLAALIMLGLVLSGCAQQETKSSAAPAPSDPAAAYEMAMADANAAQKKAASVGGEWRDTGKLMKEAQEAAKAGDYAKAKALADKATFQYKAGYEQAQSQKNVGNPRYLY